VTRKKFLQVIRDANIPKPTHRYRYEKVEDFIEFVKLAGATAIILSDCPEEIKKGPQCGVAAYHFTPEYKFDKIALLSTDRGNLYVGGGAKGVPNYYYAIYVNGVFQEGSTSISRVPLAKKVAELLDLPIREKKNP
jgi:hypothetical protein